MVAVVPSTTFLPAKNDLIQPNHKLMPMPMPSSSFGYRTILPQISRRLPFTVHAAKPPPPSVVMPKVQPKFQPPFLGFTNTAEVWNSRACMIGLIGTFIVELILNKGILQLIGVEIGKGLDLPL